ncbi:hypothetical protein [Maridesulfovibrio hydrothermalis]|uniref:DUF2269 domain-containing protein n=1 Tax=Maridesulfovibrio hydrothermalis AM13 = DSM 14728 TaxID=1121451 RepID=L0R8V6_9BACT|nr:hypothetical protein [Maridesulfovibrio hydrothermalis]CCO22615.1 conserved membrane protein of unknown function [Maridesulfovibrio hydrothermalis AM13 = DSM 14728]
MQKLSPRQTKWVRAVHMLSACLWGGGALSLVLLHCIFTPHSGDSLFARDICLKIIDQYVVTSGALGCLMTGFIFAWKTSWGFFKFKWIIAKWTINVGFILFGFFFYMPWLERMSQLSGSFRLMALQTPAYLRSQFFNEISAFAVFGCLLLVVWISIFRPWGKIRS